MTKSKATNLYCPYMALRRFIKHIQGRKNRVPKVASRRMEYRVPKIFTSSYLYLRYKFRSSTVTDKQ